MDKRFEQLEAIKKEIEIEQDEIQIKKQHCTKEHALYLSEIEYENDGSLLEIDYEIASYED